MKNIFIGGAMRSGTTLMYNIACNIKDANPQISEYMIAERLLISYKQEKESFNEFGRMYFESKEQMVEFYRDFFQKPIKNLCKIHDCEIAVLKRPEISKYVKDFFEIAPEDSYLIIMVRNPFDTIASMIKVGENMKERRINEHYLAKRDLAAMVDNYYFSYLPVLDGSLPRQYRDRIILIKYESLVANPTKSIAEIEEKIGVEINYNPDDEWQNIEFEGYKNRENNKPLLDSFVSDLYCEPITNDRVNKFTQTLKQEDLNFIMSNKHMVELCKTFGYLTKKAA